MTGSSTTILQLDDTLVNGMTYTFQYKCINTWYCGDLTNTILNDVIAQAPSFCTSPGVVSPFGLQLYNVQFTYEGDNSDVVSDVANSILAAVKAVSNDDLTFIGAVAATAQSVVVTPIQAAQVTEQTIVSGAKQVVSDTGSVASSVVSSVAAPVLNSALSAILPILIVVVLVILFVLPSLSKSVKGSGVVV